MHCFSKCWEKQAQGLNPSLAHVALGYFGPSCKHISSPEPPGSLCCLPTPETLTLLFTHQQLMQSFAQETGKRHKRPKNTH